MFSFSFHKNYKLGPTYPRHAIFSLRELHQRSPSALRAEKSSRYQSDPPENQTWKQMKWVPAWPVINQLWFPERHFSANGISLRLGEVQMKICKGWLQAPLSSAPRGFATCSRVLTRLVSLAQTGELACRLSCATIKSWAYLIKLLMFFNWAPRNGASAPNFLF